MKSTGLVVTSVASVPWAESTATLNLVDALLCVFLFGDAVAEACSTRVMEVTTELGM